MDTFLTLEILGLAFILFIIMPIIIIKEIIKAFRGDSVERHDGPMTPKQIENAVYMANIRSQSYSDLKAELRAIRYSHKNDKSLF